MDPSCSEAGGKVSNTHRRGVKVDSGPNASVAPSPDALPNQETASQAARR